MGKGDPKKPRGKMSSYAFFVQTCREEHKKKHPDASVNFSEFSKKCSERWKTMSAKEKGKFEDMAKADKARYEREMKTYIPPKGETKKKFKDPNAPKRPPSAFFLFCSEYRPKIKGEHPGLSIGDVAKKLGEMWNNTAADDKQPYEKKAAKLKEKYEKDIAAYRAKGKPDAAKKGVVKAGTITSLGEEKYHLQAQVKESQAPGPEPDSDSDYRPGPFLSLLEVIERGKVNPPQGKPIKVVVSPVERAGAEKLAAQRAGSVVQPMGACRTRAVLQSRAMSGLCLRTLRTLFSRVKPTKSTTEGCGIGGNLALREPTKTSRSVGSTDRQAKARLWEV
ncbi:high mobility group protein B1 [Mastomys coucha]|uniref:high mobility group protein B1 n=2 Tax=Eutheria TaxID=9347 RepID=UPI0012619DFF|nr:high mobility group protein B1 [Mastomys coucha]